jgi:glycerophosphoryl diester phosphodiesterase
MTSGILHIILAVVTGATPEATPFPFFEPVQPPRSLQVMAHRGAWRLAPENTKPAIEASIEDTVEWVEVDVQLTRDGRHILFHDATLDDKTDTTGPLRDRTLDELLHADAGSKFAPRFKGVRLLTLDEALRLAKGRLNLYLDCKRIDPKRLAREIVEAEMGRQVVVYGSPDVLQAIRVEAGESIGLMTKWRPRFGLHPWIEEIRPHAVEIDADDVTPEICQEFHRRGIKVQAKVLDRADRPEMWDRMASAGVDWLQTDLAEDILARRLLEKESARRVKVAHHRGASHYAPENTLDALRKAVSLRADYVEFDIRTTRDGTFVLLHDGSLDRTTSASGPVRQHQAGEIAKLDAGSWFSRYFRGAGVPTLDEFLAAAAPTGIGLYVDAKDIPPEALADALSRHGVIDRAVVYQGTEYLARLKEINPAIRRMPPLRDASQIESLATRIQPYAVDTNWKILSKDLIDRCHAHNIKVFSDAIGSHETIKHYQQAIRDGIDVIQTDHPIRVLRAVELLGSPVAARP